MNQGNRQARLAAAKARRAQLDALMGLRPERATPRRGEQATVEMIDRDTRSFKKIVSVWRRLGRSAEPSSSREAVEQELRARGVTPSGALGGGLLG
jgi:hypothetical protein